jgi:TrmH family RNA methyltransferase
MPSTVNMPTWKEQKLIRSLKLKKFRQEHRLFVVEGIKNVNCLLSSSFKTAAVYHLENWKSEMPLPKGKTEMHIVSPEWMGKVSLLESPSPVLALAQFPEHRNKFDFRPSVVPVLAGIKDPGNLGTIIRLCDWLGISSLIVSEDTVDEFNPKTVQASMGALFNVDVVRTDLTAFLSENEKHYQIPVFAADMQGKEFNTIAQPEKMILVFGSESNGIPAEVRPFIREYLHIPFKGKPLAESLNAAMAASIMLHHFSQLRE